MLLKRSSAGYEYAQNQAHDIFPGSNKAVLTLSNGKKISLTDSKSGSIAVDGNESIIKAADGTISYRPNSGSASPGELLYNTITTPRGGQWPVVILPDGSKAILDAASSIKYPVVFTGTERRVTITGQVYFEVLHDAAKPFRVDVKGQTIEDIGTHFNVNAYDDEPVIKTTLIEGSVKITRGQYITAIKPGQQAVSRNGSNSIIVSEADIDEAIAWKNGLFVFKGSDMATVMRQLSRWYDVDVDYDGAVPQRLFNGDMHRSMKASQVLEVLSFYNVHFKIDGKKIIVKE